MDITARLESDLYRLQTMVGLVGQTGGAPSFLVHMPPCIKTDLILRPRHQKGKQQTHVFIETYASMAGIAYSPVLVNMAPLVPGSALTMKLWGIPLLILTCLGASSLLSWI